MDEVFSKNLNKSIESLREISKEIDAGKAIPIRKEYGVERSVITIRIEKDILDKIKIVSADAKVGYQTLINSILADFVSKWSDSELLTEADEFKEAKRFLALCDELKEYISSTLKENS